MKNENVEMSISAKSFLLRLKSNEFIYALALIIILIVIINLLFIQNSIGKGIILCIVFIAFLLDFTFLIRKKRFFLQYILIEDDAIDVKVFSWGKLYIEGKFDRSKISAELALHKERDVSLELIFHFDQTIVKVHEDTYWNRECMLKLINWLIEDDYLQLNDDCKKLLKQKSIP